MRMSRSRRKRKSSRNTRKSRSRSWRMAGIGAEGRAGA
jgi:hypothetical protein